MARAKKPGGQAGGPAPDSRAAVACQNNCGKLVPPRDFPQDPRDPVICVDCLRAHQIGLLRK